MKLVKPAIEVLLQLRDLLEQLTVSKYNEKLTVFSGASMGQHARHILEFYDCLIQNIDTGIVNYDTRVRNNRIETDQEFAIAIINQLCDKLAQTLVDKDILLEGELCGDRFTVPSSVSRELLYTIEHAVHHMAILKMGLVVSNLDISIPANFGVADSTVKYRQQECAQ